MKGLDMVKYYQLQVDSAKEEFETEYNKFATGKEYSTDKLKILYRRYNNCKAAYDLNVGWREHNKKK